MSPSSQLLVWHNIPSTLAFFSSLGGIFLLIKYLFNLNDVMIRESPNWIYDDRDFILFPFEEKEGELKKEIFNHKALKEEIENPQNGAPARKHLLQQVDMVFLFFPPCTCISIKLLSVSFKNMLSWLEKRSFLGGKCHFKLENSGSRVT